VPRRELDDLAGLAGWVLFAVAANDSIIRWSMVTTCLASFMNRSFTDAEILRRLAL
jgi:hypothetical protein